jgi:hypothetical protein
MIATGALPLRAGFAWIAASRLGLMAEPSRWTSGDAGAG